MRQRAEPTPQPVHYRPMFGSFGSSRTQSSIIFASKAGMALGVKNKFALKKQVMAVHGIRQIKKADMVHNDCTPVMDIDAQSYAVKTDGELSSAGAPYHDRTGEKGWDGAGECVLRVLSAQSLCAHRIQPQ